MPAPQGNKNAETWTLEEVKELFQEALELSLNDDYDFIGEIARELRMDRHIFNYLSEKYPEFKSIHNEILSNLEAGCFFHTKKGKIKEGTGIVNLKSNYKWTDRQELNIPGGINLHFDKSDAKL